MITHIHHDVGTEALAKKLNEVIRVMNEGNPVSNIACDVTVLFRSIISYGETCIKYGRGSLSSQDLTREEAILKGMLGLK